MQSGICRKQKIQFVENTTRKLLGKVSMNRNQSQATKTKPFKTK